MNSTYSQVWELHQASRSQSDTKELSRGQGGCSVYQVLASCVYCVLWEFIKMYMTIDFTVTAPPNTWLVAGVCESHCGGLSFSRIIMQFLMTISIHHNFSCCFEKFLLTCSCRNYAGSLSPELVASIWTLPSLPHVNVCVTLFLNNDHWASQCHEKPAHVVGSVPFLVKGRTMAEHL